MVWVNVDLYTAFKQILFSIFFLKILLFFFNYLVILGTKKIGFSSVIFNIQKFSVSPFSSVDRLNLKFPPPIAFTLKLTRGNQQNAQVSPISCNCSVLVKNTNDNLNTRNQITHFVTPQTRCSRTFVLPH